MTDTGTLPQLIDEFVSWHFEQHPVTASAVGADGFDHRLGDFSAAAFTAADTERERWLARFDAVPDDGLTAGERIDRDLVRSTLHGHRILAEVPAWRSDPAGYVGTVFTALFLPFLHRLRPEAELVDAAVARLGQVPAVFAACRANLDPELTAPLLVHRSLRQAKTGRAFVTGSLPAEVADESLRARLATAAEPVADAFDGLVEFLADLAERATGDWRLGERRYSALLRERELLGFGGAELHEQGTAAWTDLDAELTELTASLPGGSTGWRDAVDGLAEDHPPTLAALRDEYDAATRRARQFLADHALVSFADGETCRVLPSPAFHRPLFAVPFYITPPPLTASRIGHFFVPYTPDDYGQDRVRERLRSNSRAQLPTTSVHEAYPGHHWHLSWMAGTPHLARKLFRTSYFTEGWALYAEKMMREQGFYTRPQDELAHLKARIFRAARIVVDTALHCDDMSIEQAEQYMVANGTLNPDTAGTEVNRYCAWPTQAPSYLTGALQIEQMRADYFAAGLGDLRSFHDQLAGSGCLPLGLARRAVLAG